MSRIIEVHDRQPVKVEPGDRGVWICRCGLSKNKPFCDGSHIRTRKERKGEVYLYTQESRHHHNVTHEIVSLKQRTGKSDDTVLLQADGRAFVKLSRDSVMRSHIRDLRSACGVDSSDDPTDAVSDIYLITDSRSPVACMRVTAAREARLDTEAFYPHSLLAKSFRSYVGSASRLCKIPGSLSSGAGIIRLLKLAWLDKMSEGICVDLINATQRLIPLYKRLGYREVGHAFTHPRTQLKSLPMVHVGHPGWKSRLNDELQPKAVKGFRFEEFAFRCGRTM